MSAIVKKKLAFAKLPIMQAMRAIKCGFELETQAVDGMSFDDLLGEGEFNQDAFDEEIGNRVSRVLNDSIAIRECRKLYNGRNASVRVNIGRMDIYSDDKLGKRLIELYKAYRSEMRSEVVPSRASSFSLWASEASASIEKMSRDAEFNLDEIHDTLDTYWNDELDRDNYYNEPSEDAELNINVPQGIIAKHDGSVDGPEFIVDGNGTDAPDFISLLRKLLNRFKLSVNEGCSFHIHLSVPGIKHTYGQMLQCHIMEYLLLNVSRVPKGVRKRWKTDTNYYKPRIDTDKYSFVHFHERCKTWEFRCFGNVNTVRDGMICLKLAVEALQFAYKVSLGLEKSLFNSVEDWNEELFTEVIRGGEYLSKVVKDYRSVAKKALREAA